MKQPQTLRLKNFCSYDYAELEFGDINCIKGANGHGKSNILLALVTILYNFDFPESNIRNNQKEASIEVVFTDGSSIYRYRTKTKQQIILREANGKKTEFNSSKCTEQVREFTGFKTVILDRNGSAEFLQYVPAKSPQFLLDKSPEVVLRMLSALISGQGIELVKADLQSEVRIDQSNEKSLVAAVDKAAANVEYLTSALVEKLYARAESAKSEERAVTAMEIEISGLISLKARLEHALTPDDQDYVDNLLIKADLSLTALASVDMLQAEIEDLIQIGVGFEDLFENVRRTKVELRRIDDELKETTKALQEYKCGQCGKLVRELCTNC